MTGSPGLPASTPSGRGPDAEPAAGGPLHRRRPMPDRGHPRRCPDGERPTAARGHRPGEPAAGRASAGGGRRERRRRPAPVALPLRPRAPQRRRLRCRPSDSRQPRPRPADPVQPAPRRPTSSTAAPTPATRAIDPRGGPARRRAAGRAAARRGGTPTRWRWAAERWLPPCSSGSRPPRCCCPVWSCSSSACCRSATITAGVLDGKRNAAQAEVINGVRIDPGRNSPRRPAGRRARPRPDPTEVLQGGRRPRHRRRALLDRRHLRAAPPFVSGAGRAADVPQRCGGGGAGQVRRHVLAGASSRRQHHQGPHRRRAGDRDSPAPSSSTTSSRCRPSSGRSAWSATPSC